jgi:hypothetical protein
MWKARLVEHLHVFEQHHLLDVWQDGLIRISAFWDDDIKQAVGNARLAVLLLTKEALESEYILHTELPLLRERQQRDKLPVFPVVCEPCEWRGHDWLRATQAPNESDPLSRLSEAAQIRVFRKLAADIADRISRAALADLAELGQPLPLDHIYLDKLPLMRGGGHPEKLIGRQQELSLLDLAYAQPQIAIVSLVAWGGVGKTMLVRHWLQRLQHDDWFGARRVYAWSFYSQGTKEDRQASENPFLAHALAWFGVQCEPTLSPWEKGRLLADAVARKRTLLLLDGIEPLQYPPGPMGGKLRSPGVQSLLKQLARGANTTEHHGLCLVTTREPLTDLADFQRQPDAAWGSVLRVDLGNLTEEAGAALLHQAGAKRAGAMGINTDDAELLAASREADGHALTLNLLGRFLARAHSGDIRRRDLVKFEEADRKEQGGTTFKMLAAFENWFIKSGEFGVRQLAILRMLGLFDRPADAGCINALRTPPAIAGLTDPLFTARIDAHTGQATVNLLPEEDWNTATSFLADFGLLVIQPDTSNRDHLLDCHPLVREYFAKECERTAGSWRSAHQRLYEHLRSSTDYRPESLERLVPLYQAIIHGCHAGLHEQVCFGVYLDRVLRDTDAFFSVKTLGAFSEDLSAVACFFEQPWNRLSPKLPVRAQMSLLGTAAFHLQALGRLAEAVGPMRSSASLFEKQGIWGQAVIAANNLADLELLLGDIEGALRDSERAASIAKRHMSVLEQIKWRAGYARVLHEAGRFTDGLGEIRQCEAEYASVSPFGLLYSSQGFYYCDCLLARVERAAWRVQSRDREHSGAGSAGVAATASLLEIVAEIEQRTRKTLGVAERGGQPLDVALDNLTLGRTALFQTILRHGTLCARKSEIRSFAATAVEALHAAGQQDEIPRGLLFRAWLRFLEGDTAGVRADLDEAWDIAERGPMRLHLADIHLHRARLLFREKPYPWKSPQDDLAAARQLIEQCGYWRRREELEDAEETANAL